MISTREVQNKQPFSYSDRPAPPSSVEPVLEIGDEVALDYWSGEPVRGVVVELDGNGTLAWFRVPVAVPGGGDTIALGVHRVVEVVRGDDRWRRM